MMKSILSYYCPATKLPFCHSVQGGGLMSPLSMMHWASLYKAPKHTPPPPPPPVPRTWGLTLQGPLTVLANSKHRDPNVQGILPLALSIHGTSLYRGHTGADIWWLLKYVRSAQAGGTHPTGMLSYYYCG